jgi:L-2,4-diaminobutyrate decarboxylase
MISTETVQLMRRLYSREEFLAATNLWQQKLSDHLSRVTSGTGPVLNWRNPADAVHVAEGFLNSASRDTLPESILQRFGTLIDQILSSGQNLHHPSYIGHQVPASLPLAGLCDAVGTMTNQVMAIFEMGPWATAVEMALIRRLCAKIGWNPETSSGLLTNGGSLANLTALMTARNVAFPRCWEEGTPANAVLVAQADAHYCVTRAAGILGLGTQQVRRVELDADRRMKPDHLDRLLTDLKRNGKTVIAVSACACATPTGAFDPLDLIADVCETHQVWLHVDAAHGGAALMSRQHQHILKGINRADSVVWDAHKMMFVPALCAAVLYRSREHRFQTFHQDAPYLFDPSAPGMAEFDSGMRTIECTKGALGFGLWGLWSIFGDSLFEQLIDHTFEMTRLFHGMLAESDDFEPMHVPQCNILAFRYLPSVLTTLPEPLVSGLQREIRARIMRSGKFYIVQTQLNQMAALRVTLMNPLTRIQELHDLMTEIRRVGSEILAEKPV